MSSIKAIEIRAHTVSLYSIIIDTLFLLRNKILSKINYFENIRNGKLVKEYVKSYQIIYMY